MNVKNMLSFDGKINTYFILVILFSVLCFGFYNCTSHDDSPLKDEKVEMKRFTKVKLAADFDEPTEMGIMNDGRVLVIERKGGIKLFLPQTNTLKNNSAIKRENAVVAIPWAQVLSKYPTIDTNALVITEGSNKKIISYQLEYQGTPTIQNLLVVLSISDNSSIQIQLSKGRHPAFETKTYCRFIPERKDDFAWEKDKIAHRMYGKALEATPK
jgi:hypothetical protein